MRAMMPCALSITLISLSLLCGTASAADIVKDGRPNACIVVAEDPPRSVRLAADELRTYIEKISGATLPIATQPSDAVSVNIYIGRSTHTDKLGISDKDLKYGAYRIVSGKDWLALIGQDADFTPTEPWARNNNDRVSGKLQQAWEKITGEKWGVPNGGMYKNRQRLPDPIGEAEDDTIEVWTYDERGSFNAVCGYLRELGVRWYMPGEIGEVVPKRDTIPLPQIDKTVKPDFEVRQFNVRFGTVDNEVMKWMMRLGIRNPYGLMIAHGMHTMTHTAAIRRQHPDWFALYGGKRDTQDGKRLNHLCYSSEELFRHTVRWARAQFDVYDFESVSIMPPDAYIAICQCELCQGKEVAEMGARGKLSNHVWDFVNRVAKEVRKTHPQKKIVCCAYGANTAPPTNIDKLEPNVQVIIVGGRRPRNSKPQQRELIRELRAGWLKKTDSPIMIFENYPFTSRGFYLPAFVAGTIGESINATKGVSRGEDIWLSFPRYHDDADIGFDHFQIYFTARMYWGGKDRDVADLLEEYCRLFYSPAAAEMEAFFAYCEAHWQDMEADAEKVNRALELFEAAKSQAKNGTVYAARLANIDAFLDDLRSKAELLAQKRGPVPKLRTVWEPKEPIVIDGKLDEQYWRDCPTASKGSLRELQTGRRPIFGTSVMAGWDRGGNSLYFGIRCRERPGEKPNIATTKDEDQAVWYGDLIEILLDTDAHSYYQIAVNPAGALVDLDRGADKSNWFRWESQAEVATHVADDHWTVEIRIPVTQDENDPLNQVVGRKPSQSLPWHFNICRQRVREHGTEFSAFSPTGAKSFHVPMKFAHFYDGRSHKFEADPQVTDYLIEAKAAGNLMQRRKYGEALAAYVQLADAEQTNDLQKSAALQQAAACARRLEDWQRAEELAGQVPLQAVAKTVRMENLIAQREWKKLAAQFDNEDFSQWPFWQVGAGAFARGQAYLQTGAGEKAKSDLQHALQFTSDSLTRLNILMSLARNYEQNLKDEAQALRTYKQIVESNDNRGSATYFRAVLSAAEMLREQRQYPHAEIILKHVDIEKLRGFWQGAMLLELARLRAAAGRNAEALQIYRKVLDDETKPDSQRKTAREAIEQAQQQGATTDPSLQPAHVVRSPWPRHIPPTNRQGVPSITRTAKGRLWVVYGRDVESRRTYQIVKYSDDQGRTWSDAKLMILPPQRGVRAMSATIWTDPQGRVWVIWGQAYGVQDGRYGIWTITSSNPDAAKPDWTEPRRIGDGIMMNKPTVLSNGDWLFVSSVWKTDNSVHVYASTDRGQTFQLRGTANVLPPKARGPDEPMIVERRDSSLWLWIRSHGIVESFSNDRGKTWSPVQRSAVRHPTARFFIRRLKSGNLLLVKHGPVEERTKREKLMAFLSDDDGKTWSGGLMIDEREHVTYPDGVQAPDGTIYLVYDYKRTPEGAVLMATFREEDVRGGGPATDHVQLRREIARLDENGK